MAMALLPSPGEGPSSASSHPPLLAADVGGEVVVAAASTAAAMIVSPVDARGGVGVPMAEGVLGDDDGGWGFGVGAGLVAAWGSLRMAEVGRGGGRDDGR